MAAAGVLLLTGVTGIGKTTVIRRVADRLKERRIRGFYTEEIREGGDRLGFRLVVFNGTERVIANVDFPKVRRVGKYGVDVGAIDEATELLADDPAVQVYLVDNRQDGVSVRALCGCHADSADRTKARCRHNRPPR
jgi:nucleoside-triphosphatase